eukprot:TRINITY_DN4543_c0_g1_i1.p1 TRINITY_DN4543_c0_g1~~TRINITY_DN4543_c0_g1_i1.p1  ORF type:complete len:287 (+),score=33.26 TRINITY_DN4543_c0_g1_i1:391-1251(+)
MPGCCTAPQTAENIWGIDQFKPTTWSYAAWNAPKHGDRIMATKCFKKAINAMTSVDCDGETIPFALGDAMKLVFPHVKAYILKQMEIVITRLMQAETMAQTQADRSLCTLCQLMWMYVGRLRSRGDDATPVDCIPFSVVKNVPKILKHCSESCISDKLAKVCHYEIGGFSYWSPITKEDRIQLLWKLKHRQQNAWMINLLEHAHAGTQLCTIKTTNRLASQFSGCDELAARKEFPIDASRFNARLNELGYTTTYEKMVVAFPLLDKNQTRIDNQNELMRRLLKMLG